MANRRVICVISAFIVSIVLLAPAYHAVAQVGAPIHFAFFGAVFEDGGELTGGVDFWPDVGGQPMPQFFNLYVRTTDGITLSGSDFQTFTYCYNAFQKKPTCAPGDNFLMLAETGVYGQPGYRRLQLAMYFAPGIPRQMGTLDTRASYEMACSDDGCFYRHISSGVMHNAGLGS